MGEARAVSVAVQDGVLDATLGVPDHARGLVVLAQETGTGRLLEKHRALVRRLQEHGLGTLLVQLLTEEEDESERWTRHLRLDEDETEARTRFLKREVSVFTDRLLAVSAWVERTLPLSRAYFGASTAAAAALTAAARTADVAAVVSQEGCVDLAADCLPAVRAPTLFLVGPEDGSVLERHRSALKALRCPVDLRLVPGPTVSSDDPAVLDAVADWYDRYITGPQP